MHDEQRETLSSAGLLILRLGVGGFLLTHGVGKVKMLAVGNFEQMGDPIGIGPVASLVLITLAEFLCSILVMLGLGTRFAAIPVVIAMAVAAFVALGGEPWTLEKAAQKFFAGETQFPAAKEGALLYLIPFLALVFTGAGRYSLDAWIGQYRRG